MLSEPPALHRLMVVIRHTIILLSRDSGPIIGYTVMPLLLMVLLRPLFDQLTGSPAIGVAQTASGMVVMFSLFAMKIVGINLLNEQTWGTWRRLLATPTRAIELLAGKAIPLLGMLVAQELLLLAFAIFVQGLRPAGALALATIGLVWPLAILAWGTAAASMARSSAQLSATTDVLTVVVAPLGGALAPVAELPSWAQLLAPVSPGYWGVRGFRSALVDGSLASVTEPAVVLLALAAVGFGVALFGVGHLGRTRGFA